MNTLYIDFKRTVSEMHLSLRNLNYQFKGSDATLRLCAMHAMCTYFPSNFSKEYQEQ